MNFKKISNVPPVLLIPPSPKLPQNEKREKRQKYSRF